MQRTIVRVPADAPFFAPGARTGLATCPRYIRYS